ncbi:Ankyrin repeats (3 copies) [Symmachiella macrocystis]|uniref:Ankyrin repeats (3 copies) n=1 Tax=Symmachiella macrocystis TaxID=2527985 RepID=A0A5C6BPZ2_9PLAN|nr:ankyrin repeat domain-containing protein [Symmachiella macrocystis]TWU13762.1 Ankyrin repeats (3 copies) [Symmachiella macrocystis]
MRWFYAVLMTAMIFITGCGGSAGGVNVWDAVEQNDAAAIRTYSNAGGDLDIRSFGGETPLFLALSLKHFESYKALLECGAGPNVIMSKQRVVTHWAAIEEDPKWLKLALEHGANPDLVNIGSGPPNKGTPFHFAISSSHIDNIKLLIEYGADINKPDRLDCPPVTVATLQNDFEVVLLLLESGADYKSARCGGRTFQEIMDERKLIKGKYFDRPEVQDQLRAIETWLEEHK